MEYMMTCLFLPFLLQCSGRPHAIVGLLTQGRFHVVVW